MRLLSGPAGSGKTTYILDRFRHALRAGNSDIRLLVPTATMAQHLQNRLAREGFVFRGSLIQTLSSFVRDYAGSAAEVSPAVLYLLVEEAAQRVARPEFYRVTRFPGFCNSLARTIDEFASAGCDSVRLAASLPDVPLGDAFLAVYREVDRELARRGLAMRARRLELAAAQIAAQGLSGIDTIWMDGFHALPDPELRVIAAMATHADLTLTLGDEDLPPALGARLTAMGFTAERAPARRARPALALVKAPGIEREVEEIARRILLQSASGRPFREIGVIVRSPDIYVPVLRSTLERFGIPARFYFDTKLERHAVVRFLSGAIDAMLGGWDHARTLAVLRLTPRFADFPIADRFDFDVRDQIPNAGLSELRSLLIGDEGQPRPGAERLLHKLESLSALEEWRSFVLTPGDWAARFGTLRNLFRPAPPADSATHELALQWRSQSAALSLFDHALAEAASALDGAREIPIEDYWRAVKSVLRLKPLRLEDGRRNVVHVMSAHEARQWVLPIVFVCGMVEKQFPHFHQQDPFFPDAARCRLNAAGIRARTAAEFEREERALFDTATSRATMLVTLSYPEFDSRGERNLPSIYLEDLLEPPVDSVAVRPTPRSLPAPRGPAEIAAPDLLDYLRRRTAHLSPTALETFLQCPFQYFTQRLMRLKTAPLRPEERLSFLEQGNIVHEVLAEWWQQPQDVAPLFERIFARHLQEVHIPDGYHTERLRNAMLDDLKRFTTGDAWPRAAWKSQTEIEFTFSLAEGLEIAGRMDRMDVAPDGRAFVLDYKYSAAQRVKDKLKNENLMQPPLYMMAAEHLNVRPAGMFYVGVKGGIEYAGWSDDRIMDSLALPENWLASTRDRTLLIVGEMRRGRVEIRPADRDSCRFCDAKDVCRIEVAAPAAESSGAGASAGPPEGTA
ncbi:MAG: PD-(D/E)XK nuclease family protein [Candidatus Solibacter sp.]|nr:PD-(D/E)XK nuclease family protein [Candidatus Solibacter sp.]